MTSNVKGCSKLIFFMIDGLGFNIFDKYADKDFFKVFKDKGQINKITSVFPPTTASAITTLHTGLAPIEHGYFEWNLYMPSIGEIIESLPYEIVVTEFTDTKTNLPQNSSLIFNGKTIYETLKENQVESVIFLPEDISDGIYTKATSRKAKVIGYKDLPDLLFSLVSTLEHSNSQLFCYVYWPAVDNVEHAYGVWTDETKKEVEKLSKYLEQDFLIKLSSNISADTGIFFTADHGQEDIDLENITLLNNHSYLTERYELNSKGNPILPSGSPRDIFLHIKQDKIDEIISYLEKELNNKSQVLKLDKQTIKQLFGNFTPHGEFLKRLGNVLILSKGSHACWYEYNIEKKLDLKGHHGSLLKGEMIIPFGSAKASDLT
ncbi:MAG: alkaline phosphatase family protein [Patescibacteria group bacterium]